MRISDWSSDVCSSDLRQIVEGGLAKAETVLTEHLAQLHALAGALLEYETLSGDEIKKLIAGEALGRADNDAGAQPVVAAGTPIPKTSRPPRSRRRVV